MRTLLTSGSNRISQRAIVSCLFMTGLLSNLIASPDDWSMQASNNNLSAWNFYMDSDVTAEDNVAFPLPEVALSCLPDVNISLGQGGYVVLTALMLVNAPQYDASQYVVDIMGPLTNTVTCAQLGQELMVVVTETPTGNSCMSTVFIEDKLRPVLNCTADVLPCNVDIATLDFEDYLEPVFDNCDPDPDVWYSYVIQNLPCNANHYTQQILVTWTATDNSGNSATCQDIIYLRQPALGEIVFPSDISISCVNANIDPSVTGEPTFNGEPLGGTCGFTVTHTDVVIPMCPGAQKILRTWNAMDWCTSGQVSDVQVILIVDNNAPVITCPPNITVSANLGMCTANYTLPNPPVSDACANANQIDVDIFVAGIPGIYSPGQVVNLGLGTTLITVRATDPCGNSSQCHFTVTVRDNTPPLIICPGNVTVDCTASTLPANTGSATAIDLCDSSPDITYTDVTTASQSCALGYNITRTWKATDNSGNTAICMQMIVFTDA
ncbi:MAG: HYR domain-containing protein, partial [Saprospiraceae bacterium]|nr:HYR domain-containing protein [Saprospiraceae bacterium]